MDRKGVILDIQKFSIHDGPGIRTTVFLKGCPLNCLWCHNPESKKFQPQLSYDANKCIMCGKCETVCPANVHKFENNKHCTDYSKCILCGKCVEACLVNALSIYGKSMSVNEIISEVKKDKKFFDNTGGGITISGGEPLSQQEFTAALAKEAKEQGIHVTVETSGFASKESVERVAEYTDLFLFDYKVSEDELSEKLIGIKDLNKILENLDLICSKKKDIIIRCPFIPKHNITEKHFRKIAELEKKYPDLLGIEILPYHNFGKNKADSIGDEYEVEVKMPEDSEVDSWLVKFRELGCKKVYRNK
ncbi:glycyl-radical enzyme activating protein [Sebaldella sp. S0638]|uniref:glycyl-radical enzyme activating protein n=1 Tax=Sebaldella sp. S0638 TaxID=2957809 RepID=UPI00209C704C|nr:glycyl-radical enzyme activating protein [Sebaldella sp. S0638]MCP1222918.1 glycyl-radical enzyme activating protein [Sebaldella sp. S0638]